MFGIFKEIELHNFMNRRVSIPIPQELVVDILNNRDQLGYNTIQFWLYLETKIPELKRYPHKKFELERVGRTGLELIEEVPFELYKHRL